MPRGGKRPGAGKPKGYKHANTLEKAAAREYFLARIHAELESLVTAQITLAKAGDARMLISLMDRLVDKPKEVVEVSGPGWQPLFALPAGIQPSVTNPNPKE